MQKLQVIINNNNYYYYYYCYYNYYYYYKSNNSYLKLIQIAYKKHKNYEILHCWICLGEPDMQDTAWEAGTNS